MKKLTWAMGLAAVVVATGVQGQTANQPSGRDILVKSLHATGADTIMKKHTSMKMIGTFNVPSQGVSASMENSRSSAGAFHVVIDIQGYGAVEQGYADSTAWSIMPGVGPAILQGAQAASSKRQAAWIDGPDNYTSITNEGMTKFQGKDAWKVKFESKDGLQMTRYFDPTTGLAMATSTMQDVGQGPMEVITTMTDYKDFGGLLFPVKQVQMIGDAEQDITLEKIEWDTAPASAFVLPPEIKALKGK